MSELLTKRFQEIGARVKVRTERRSGFGRRSSATRLDVLCDRRGEYFDIALAADSDADIQVLDVRPEARHLLLMVRQPEEDDARSKFLCGHDERHWFVAAVPENDRGVRDVPTAMAALQPPEVRVLVHTRHVKNRERFARRNEAFVRQGEWFFIPAPDLVVDEKWVLRNEPLSRGAGSKAHTMEFCYRRGGDVVYVSRRYPGGLSSAAYHRLPEKEQRGDWRTMVRDAEVYTRRRISHPDHATIVLRGWHRVRMNTENQSRAMQHVAFLD